ncbi:MAG: glycosyltransferase [Myxococcales bacterium]|nr:MAG: glycosyltransferase [Myxococcales bacterium]
MKLDAYKKVTGIVTLRMLRQLAKHLKGAKVVHVNSTRQGGGVAEILSWLIPLKRDLGIDASWEVIEGDEPFFALTKIFHNALQGNPIDASPAALRAYEETSESNAARLRPLLEEADFVFIHDPQPARLILHCPNRKGRWFWRCHIDASRPHRPIWKYLAPVVQRYDASVFSMVQFAQPVNHPQFLIAPSIDPLSEKNCDLPQEEIGLALESFSLDPARPILTQISRFDRFKDPLGVIAAYRLVKQFMPVQLVLAGGGASDDPEGEAVLSEVRQSAANDPDIHILLLPGDAHRTINALQRGSDIVIQKSLKEGFGLTVTEGLWKGKPVIGGDVGGIKLQVIPHHTGYLVHTPEGAAHWIRYLLQHRPLREAMGRKGREFVRENFLLSRHLREYLTLMMGFKLGMTDRLMAG